MIRENATKVFPLAYLGLLIFSLVLFYFEIDAGFLGLAILSAPWSLLIFFFAGWTMMHDGSAFGFGVVLFVIGAVFNSALVYRAAYDIQYSATIGND